MRFRFSLLNLLLLTTLIAVLFGWWLDRSNLKQDLKRRRFEHSVGQRNHPTRKNAVTQLGKIGSVDSVPALVYALADPSFDVAECASIALQKITGQQLRVNSPLRKGTEYSYGTCNQSEVEKLTKAFETEQILWIVWLSDTHPEIQPYFNPMDEFESRSINSWLLPFTLW